MKDRRESALGLARSAFQSGAGIVVICRKKLASTIHVPPTGTKNNPRRGHYTGQRAPALAGARPPRRGLAQGGGGGLRARWVGSGRERVQRRARRARFAPAVAGFRIDQGRRRTRRQAVEVVDPSPAQGCAGRPHTHDRGWPRWWWCSSRGERPPGARLAPTTPWGGGGGGRLRRARVGASVQRSPRVSRPTLRPGIQEVVMAAVFEPRSGDRWATSTMNALRFPCDDPGLSRVTSALPTCGLHVSYKLNFA